jgi:hypothetical protein
MTRSSLLRFVRPVALRRHSTSAIGSRRYQTDRLKQGEVVHLRYPRARTGPLCSPQPASADIDVELHELDRAVGRELSDDGEPSDERPGPDEDAVVRPAGDQLGEVEEPGGEPLDDPQQQERLEVVGRRLAARSARRWRLPVEILEEVGRRGRRADRDSPGRSVAGNEALLGSRADPLQERSRDVVQIGHDARAEERVLFCRCPLLELLGRPHLPRHGLRLSDRPSRTLDGAGRRGGSSPSAAGRSMVLCRSQSASNLLAAAPRMAPRGSVRRLPRGVLIAYSGTPASVVAVPRSVDPSRSRNAAQPHRRSQEDAPLSRRLVASRSLLGKRIMGRAPYATFRRSAEQIDAESERGDDGVVGSTWVTVSGRRTQASTSSTVASGARTGSRPRSLTVRNRLPDRGRRGSPGSETGGHFVV